MLCKNKNLLEFIQWKEDNFEDVKEFLHDLSFVDGEEEKIMEAKAMQFKKDYETITFCVGQYIVRNLDGSYAVYNEDEFKRLYDVVVTF